MTFGGRCRPALSRTMGRLTSSLLPIPPPSPRQQCLPPPPTLKCLNDRAFPFSPSPLAPQPYYFSSFSFSLPLLSDDVACAIMWRRYALTALILSVPFTCDSSLFAHTFSASAVSLSALHCLPSRIQHLRPKLPNMMLVGTTHIYKPHSSLLLRENRY